MNSLAADAGLLVIGLLGFETAGKTWFLHRLKKHGYGGWKISPPAVGEGTQNPSILRTVYITEHKFTNGPFGARMTFLDIPGEKFTESVQAVFQDCDEVLIQVLRRCDAFIIMLPAVAALFAHELADPRFRRLARAVNEKTLREKNKIVQDIAESNDKLKTATGSQKAMLDGRIAILEAELDDVEFVAARGQSGVEDLQQMLSQVQALPAPADPDKASERIATIAALAEKLEELQQWRLADSAVQMSDFEDRLAHMIDLLRILAVRPAVGSLGANVDLTAARKTTLLSKPVFAALSKMDEVIEPSERMNAKFTELGIDDRQREKFDQDPDQLLWLRRLNLCEALTSRLEWCRIDCVSAFPGQGREGGATEISYKRAPHGIDGVVEWIQWAREQKRGDPITRWTTAWARRLRDATRPR